MNLNHLMRGIILLTLFITFPGSTRAAEFFISLDGKDNQSGTLEQPFLTMAPALNHIEKNAGKDNVTIYFREGTYHLNAPVVLQPKHSGSDNGEILFTNWQDEAVTISGGFEMELDWSRNQDGAYQANVDAQFDELYVNNQRYRMARFPNFDPNAKFFGGTSKEAISPDQIKTWANPIGGYLHALHEGMWGSKHYQIEGVNNDDSLQLRGGWQENRGGGFDDHYRGGYHKDHLFVENIQEELDAPGEWFYDGASSMLYVIPRNDDDLNSATVIATRLHELIQLQGTEDSPIKNIHFKNLKFQYTSRIFMQPYERLLRGDWSIARLSALRLKNTEDCSVSNCEFTNLGGNAVFLDGYNRQAQVINNYFKNIGESAICIIGDFDAVRSPAISYSNTLPQDEIDLTPGPKSNQYPVQCLIEGNLIHDIGTIGKQTAGVIVSMAEEITIRHNTIFNIPRAAICINDGCWGGHIIEYNDAFDTVRESGDHGPFNSWGRDRFWKTSYNGGRDIEPFAKERALLDNYKTTHIRLNRFAHDAGHSWGIDLDDGSSNYHVYKNLCIGMGVKLREGFYRRVENNVIINGFGGFHIWFPGCDDVIERNIFVSDKPYQFIRANPSYAKSFDNNLFFNNGDAPMVTGVGDPMAINAWQKKGFDKNSLVADPKFINPSAGDYRVKDDSPAIKLGFENFPMDRFGVTRDDFKTIVDNYRQAHPQNKNSGDIAAKRKPNPQRFLGAAIDNLIGKDQMSAAGMIKEAGVRFVAVPTESEAYRLGVREGDVLIHINNTEIETVSDCLRVYKNTSEQNVTFTLHNATERTIRVR
ncbi:MAG: right-handed parallel beta-helix repeat-containing protein [Candidatus Hinthialibacter antarcticus]|nr:right-handed parallel beta-helix repeat-containing protein [Candidatus Hinthialibacter antarcticus]